LLATITSALVAYGPWGVLLIGMIDSIGIPLPATIDALLILIAMKAPDRAYLAASLAVVGSLAGNLALFQAAQYGVQRLTRGVPKPGESHRFREWFHRYGLISIFIPAAIPILPLPLKVFVVSAGGLRAPRTRFAGIILVARTLRYFGLAYLGRKLGADAQGYLQRNAWTLIGIGIGVAAVLYVLMRINDRRQSAPIS